MKKIFSLLLSVMLCLSLAACGTDETDVSSVEANTNEVAVETIDHSGDLDYYKKLVGNYNKPKKALDGLVLEITGIYTDEFWGIYYIGDSDFDGMEFAISFDEETEESGELDSLVLGDVITAYGECIDADDNSIQLYDAVLISATTLEATQEPTPEATPEPTPEATPEPTPEVTPEPTPEVTPEPTPEPTLEPAPKPTPTPTPKPVVTEYNATMFAISYGTIWSGPYDNYTVLGHYNSGTEVSVVGKTTDKDGDTWYKINYNGEEGYMSQYHLSTTKPTPTPQPTTAPVAPAPADPAPAPAGNERTYVVNTNTGKFHYPGCSSVSDIKPHNRMDVVTSHDALIAQGYVPCKRCH